jgi:phosphate/phosphite/phosphonate ABC transporter binding protein
MYERFLPFKYYLEDTLKRPVVIRVAKDYESAIYDIGNGHVHMSFLDPAAYVEVRARYKNRVIPLVRVIGEEGAASRSVFVTKEGSGIEKITDVRGKRLALGSKNSSFSYLIPIAMLNDVGIGIKDFESVNFLQQEDRVALSVLIGDHDVGAISESVARKYIPYGLKIIKSSESIPQFVLCASDKLSPDIRKQIIKSPPNIKLHGHVSIDRFAVAEDRDFDVIRVMIKNLNGKNYIEYGPKTIKVAILPLYSAITIYDRYEPLMRYLSEKTGYEFKLVIPKNFEDFVRMVKSGEVLFSYQNPYIFALISKEVNIKPLVTTVGEDCLDEGICGEDRFRGVIITGYNSGIMNIGDLKGKKIMIVSPTSAGGYLSQKMFLKRKGIDVERDVKIIDAKRQENVILGVYRGEADAGFIRESALAVWKEEIDMKKIRVLAPTDYLPNWPFASIGNNNPALAHEVRKLLIELKDADILEAARIKGFRPAKEEEFEALKQL